MGRLGLEEVEEAFAKAAEMSESEYVVTTDAEELKEAFAKVLGKVKTVSSNDMSQVSIEVEKENAYGSREEYGDTTAVKLSPLRESEDEVAIELIQEVTGQSISHFDRDMADLLSGVSGSDRKTIITSRLQADKERQGEAVKIHVGELVFMDSLCGVEAPYGHRFLG